MGGAVGEGKPGKKDVRGQRTAKSLAAVDAGTRAALRSRAIRKRRTSFAPIHPDDILTRMSVFAISDQAIETPKAPNQLAMTDNQQSVWLENLIGIPPTPLGYPHPAYQKCPAHLAFDNDFPGCTFNSYRRYPSALATFALS